MQIHQVCVVLSTDRLADMGLDYDGDIASNLLALWTVAWHPRLIATTGSIPTIRSVDSLLAATEIEGELQLVPSLTWGDDVATWRDNLSSEQQRLVPELSKATLRDEIWRIIAGNIGDRLAGGSVSDSDAAEFYALGYAYFQIEMLTRVMSYQSVAEESQIVASVVSAAKKVLAGEPIDEELAAAYDGLTQCRNHYYPVDFYLVDVTLLAAGLLDQPLRNSLTELHEQNLLLTGEMAEQIVHSHAETASAIKRAVAEGRLELIGGSQAGGDLNRFGAEPLLADLLAAHASLAQLAATPRSFANFDGVVAPLIPKLSAALGYHGVLVTNFAGQRLPPLYPPRCRWQGLDGTSIEALVASPLDRADLGTMLRFSELLSQAMDNDLVATLVLAGWPGETAPYFEDLKVIARRSEVLGRFVKLSDYFTTTTSADRIESLATSYYRGASSRVLTVANSSIEHGLFTLASGNSAATQAVDPAAWARLLGIEATDTANADGWLYVNFSPNSRSHFGSQCSLRPVKPWGFAWEPTVLPPPPVPIADGTSLRNELLEFDLSETNGGIASLRLHQARGTQLSQKLMLLGSDEFQLAFDGHTNVESFPRKGCIESRMRIVNRSGKTLLSLIQSCRVIRNSAEVDLTWRVESKSEPFPAGLRLASRVAWRDQSAGVSWECQGIALPVHGDKIAPTAWVHVDSQPTGITLSTSLPCQHHRVELNWLDTQLPLEPMVYEPFTVRLAMQRTLPIDGGGQVCIPTRGQPAQREGWWLHLSSPSIAVTHIEPVADGEMLIRVLETSGHQRQCRLDTWTGIAEGRIVDHCGNHVESLAIEAGTARLHLAGYEFAQIVMRNDLAS